MDLGIALGQSGRLDPAIAATRKAIELKPEDAKAHANLGAAEAGWTDTAHMATDTDLDSLRDDPRYKDIIKLMEGKKE